MDEDEDVVIAGSQLHDHLLQTVEAGCLETMMFCSMYSSNNNMSSMVSSDRLAQIVGTEKHLRSYSQYYGQQSEKLVCDTCKEVHGF